MSQREDRLRAQARERYLRNQERLNRFKVRPPSNADALAEINAGMTEGQAAAQRALGEIAGNPDAGMRRVAEGHRESGGTPERLSEEEAMEQFVDRVSSDPALLEKLTPSQRMAYQMRLNERKLQVEIAAEEEAEATASGDA
jgi:hypothetical protein